MVNVRAIANVLTRTINPNITVTFRKSLGFTQGADYKQVASYAAPVTATAQVQSLSRGETEHLDAMNLAGPNMRAIYANVQMNAADRTTQSGGDLLDFIDPETGQPSTWLVTEVLEGWGGAGWCKAAITKQMDQ